MRISIKIVRKPSCFKVKHPVLPYPTRKELSRGYRTLIKLAPEYLVARVLNGITASNLAHLYNLAQLLTQDEICEHLMDTY